VTKPRFEQVVAALMQVGKEEADAIIEAEKRPYFGEKRGRKPRPPEGG
jgi:hypothetical protein